MAISACASRDAAFYVPSAFRELICSRHFFTSGEVIDEAARIHHCPWRRGGVDDCRACTRKVSSPEGWCPVECGKRGGGRAVVPALVEGFRELGYIDGQNIVLEHRFPSEMPERFRSMAAELVSLNVDVLVSSGNTTPYAKNATATIPLVFMFVGFPLKGVAVAAGWDQIRMATHLMFHGARGLGMASSALSPVVTSLARDAPRAPACALSAGSPRRRASPVRR